MKILLSAMLLLLSLNSYASNDDQCETSAKIAYDKCMLKYSKFGSISESACEDPYIKRLKYCRPDVKTSEDFSQCISMCLSQFNRCLAHQARFNNSAVCEDGYTQCYERCER